jgi:hypothetical protein
MTALKTRLPALGAVVVILASAALVGGLLAPTAFATGTCDNYAPTVVSGYCPVTGTLQSVEYKYSFGRAALGNEIGLASGRSWNVQYRYATGPHAGEILSSLSGSGQYGALGGSGGVAVNVRCTNLGSAVTGNCDVQYTV